MTEDEVAGWHHRLDGHEFEQAPGVGDGQGRPGVLQAMGLQRIGRDWTELSSYLTVATPHSEPWGKAAREVKTKDTGHRLTKVHIKGTKLVEVMEFQLGYFKS